MYRIVKITQTRFENEVSSLLRKKQFKNNDHQISSDLTKNINKIKADFSYQINNDFSIRLLTAKFNQREICLCYLASLVNSDKIEQSIIQPLLEQDGQEIINIITVESIKSMTDCIEINHNITSGKFFIYGRSFAYSIDVLKFEHRGCHQSKQSVVRGPKEVRIHSR